MYVGVCYPLYLGVFMRVPAYRIGHRTIAAITTMGSVVALTLGASACAKHPAYDADAATHPVEIQVDNNVTPVYLFAIYLREGNGTGGSRRELGNAPGSQLSTFTFTPTRFGQQYTLQAVPPIGTTITRTLSIDNPNITSLRWNLNQNILSYFGNN
jgi:hypothetical protein